MVDWAREITINKFGFTPLYVQYTIAADLQWRVRQEYDMSEVLTEEEIERYQKRLFSSLSWIEDKIILQQKMLWIEHKYYMLQKKHETFPYYNIYVDDAELIINNTAIGWLSGNYVKIEFIEFKNNELIIEGFAKFLAVSEKEKIDIYFEVEYGDTMVPQKSQCQLDNDIKYNEYRFGELLYRAVSYTHLTLPTTILV